MEKNVLCIDRHGMVSFEMAISLKQAGLNVIGVGSLQEAGYILRVENIPVLLLVFVVESADCFDKEAIKAFTMQKRVKDIPIIVLCPVHDNNLRSFIQSSGFGFVVDLPFDERAFLKKVREISGFEPKGYIQGLDKDLIIFSFDDMLTREMKAAARGQYSFALLMLTVVAEDGRVRDQEIQHSLVVMLKSLLKTYLRETDSVFLAGLNGITAILPFTDRKGVESVVQRAKELFSSHSEISRLSEGYGLKAFSVIFPDEARTRTKLLERLKTFTSVYLQS